MFSVRSGSNRAICQPQPTGNFAGFSSSKRWNETRVHQPVKSLSPVFVQMFSRHRRFVDPGVHPAVQPPPPLSSSPMQEPVALGERTYRYRDDGSDVLFELFSLLFRFRSSFCCVPGKRVIFGAPRSAFGSSSGSEPAPLCRVKRHNRSHSGGFCISFSFQLCMFFGGNAEAVPAGPARVEEYTLWTTKTTTQCSMKNRKCLE